MVAFRERVCDQGRREWSACDYEGLMGGGMVICGAAERAQVRGGTQRGHGRAVGPSL